MRSAQQELIDIGKAAFRNKDYDRAAQCLLTVLADGNIFPDILNLLGVIYHHQGDFNKAIEVLQKALEVNPDYREATLNLAVVYNDLGEYKEARKLYDRLSQKPKKKSPIDSILKGELANRHANMGDLYRRLGRFKEAAMEYRKSLELAPEFADIRMRLGMALREVGQNAASLKELRRVCKEKPRLLEARTQLGLTLYVSGKKSAAVKEWRTVLKKDKKNSKVLMYLSLPGNGVPSKRARTRK